MARITDQTIPSELLDKYKATLDTEPWVTDDDRVATRHPFRIPTLQGCRTIRPPIKKGSKVTVPMCAHRHIFGDCIKCFQKQPTAGGVEPPAIGPRNRSWWFTDAIGKMAWYFNWFMLNTLNSYVAETPPDWCKTLATTGAFTFSHIPEATYCGQSYLYAMWKNIGIYRSYIKKVGTDTDTLWLRAFPFDREEEQDYPIKIAAYNIPDDWTCNILTWNNQPPLGAKLDEVWLYSDASRWIHFHVGNVTSVAIVMLSEHWAATFFGVGADHQPSRPAWI